MVDETIRAVAFTAPETAELVEVEPDPRPLGPREVTGRTLASLISPGTELHSGYLASHFPSYPGYAAVCAVEQWGSEVSDLRPGQVVFCMGGHRSHQRTDRANVVPVPDGLAPEVATFARLMCVTWSTLVTTKARPNSLVMVTGLGPVGHLACQIFSAAGYQVIGVDPVEARRQVLQAKGVADVRPAVPLEDATVVDRVRLALDCSGHEQAVLDACRAVCRGGEVVLVGVPWRKRTELSAHELLHTVFHRYVYLRSGWEWEVPRQATAFAQGSITENVTGALAWLSQRRVNVDGLYEKVDPATCGEVYRGLHQAPGAALSYVFDWSRGPSR